MKKFSAALLILLISAVVMTLTGCASVSFNKFIRSLPLPSPASQTVVSHEFIENRDAVMGLDDKSATGKTARNTASDFTETFGPVTEEITSISVTSGDDLVSQFIDVMNGRTPSVTIKVPCGSEEFYMNELKEQMQRFTDITQMQTKWISYSGSCTVDITYNDSVTIMAYLEGKIPELSEDNLQVLNEAIRIHDMLITDDMSQYEIVKAFHDYIVEFNSYKDTGDRSHSVVGALIDGQSVCEGYAEALDLLCYLSGIECIEVDGTGETSTMSGPHAWNKVKVEGVWYNVDVTWDDPVSSSPILRHDYFLVSDERMAQDHQWYLYPHIPSADYDYDD